MEKVNFESLSLLLFLIPGFLSIIIYNNLIYRKDLDVFSKIVEALIYSLLIYLSVALLTGTFLIKGVTISTTHDVSQIVWQYNRPSIFLTISFSVIFPILIGYLNRYDLPLRFLRMLKVTNRTGRPSIWLDVFYDLKRAVIVHMKDRRRLFGWPQYFSDNIGPGPLYLRRPSWISPEGEYVDLDIDGVFLVDHTEIAHIEFLNGPEKEALNG